MNKFSSLNEIDKREIDEKYSKSRILNREKILDPEQGISKSTLDDMKGDGYWVNKSIVHYAHFSILGIVLTPTVLKAYGWAVLLCIALSFIAS